MRGTVCVYAEELKKGRQRERERIPGKITLVLFRECSSSFVVQINFHDCCSGSYVEDYIQSIFPKHRD
jgi:hypothetical protein